jgi:hypothetical protein
MVFSRTKQERSCSKGFPKLMQNKVTGAVFLMTSKRSGTKLTAGEGGINPIGQFDKDWYGMEDFEGVLELSNTSF